MQVKSSVMAAATVEVGLDADDVMTSPRQDKTSSVRQLMNLVY